jgi:hypothetical protein
MELTGSDDLMQVLTLRAQKVLSGRFALTTWRRHLYLNRMMADFANTMRTHLTDEIAILALEWIGTGTTRRTLLGYARTVRSSSRRFQTELMDAFISGLAVMAAQEPLRQAGLLSKEEIRRIIAAAPAEMKWLIWITFLTASRWGDTQGLSDSRSVGTGPP